MKYRDERDDTELEGVERRCVLRSRISWKIMKSIGLGILVPPPQSGEIPLHRSVCRKYYRFASSVRNDPQIALNEGGSLTIFHYKLLVCFVMVKSHFSCQVKGPNMQVASTEHTSAFSHAIVSYHIKWWLNPLHIVSRNQSFARTIDTPKPISIDILGFPNLSAFRETQFVFDAVGREKREFGS